MNETWKSNTLLSSSNLLKSWKRFCAENIIDSVLYDFTQSGYNVDYIDGDLSYWDVTEYISIQSGVDFATKAIAICGFVLSGNHVFMDGRKCFDSFTTLVGIKESGVFHKEAIVEFDTLFKRLNNALIEEVAKININENDIFPSDKFEIMICSNDHNPPHSHIKSAGWNISFEIDTGKEIEVIEHGEQINVYKYISDNVNKWLDNRCALIPKITNRENAMAQWIQLHD